MKKEINLNNCIELDKDAIKNSIISKGVYEDEGVKIKNWEGEKDSEYYIGTLNKNKSSYLGILNVKLKRQNFGVNKYENGDVYFGFFDNDNKAKHGAYFYHPTTESGKVVSEIYYGFWRENQKDHHGIYIWKSEKSGNKDFNEADFDAYVGEIELDSYKKGCYLTKSGANFYVYYGKFDEDGKKNDDRAFFYDNSKDRVFTGKIVNDKFVNGYLVYYDADGSLKNIVYVEFDNNDTPSKVTKHEDIELTAREKVQQDVTAFRDVLLAEDYFGLIYEKVSAVTTFAKNDMTDIGILDHEDGYPKIMKIGSAYNDIKIYTKLQNELS